MSIVKYGTTLYKCINCGLQITEPPDEFEKHASAFSCKQGTNKHKFKLVTKKELDEEIQKI